MKQQPSKVDRDLSPKEVEELLSADLPDDVEVGGDFTFDDPTRLPDGVHIPQGFKARYVDPKMVRTYERKGFAKHPQQKVPDEDHVAGRDGQILMVARKETIQRLDQDNRERAGAQVAEAREKFVRKAADAFVPVK